MSYLGKNLRKIRTIKKLSQSAFADLFELNRGNISAYEEERAEAKIETIIQIAKYFGISLEALLTKELTVNEIIQFDKHIQETQNTNGGSFGIPLIESIRAKDYIRKRQDADFLDTLPRIQFPAIEKNMRAFEYTQGEMYYMNQGIFPGDILICIPENIETQESKKLCVIVSQTNIQTGQYLNIDNNTIKIRPLNPNFEATKLIKEQIVEIWQIKYIISKNIPHKGLIESNFI